MSYTDQYNRNLRSQNHQVHFENHRHHASKSPQNKQEYIEYLEKQMGSLANNRSHKSFDKKQNYSTCDVSGAQSKDLKDEIESLKNQLNNQNQMMQNEISIMKQELRDELNMKVEVILKEVQQQNLNIQTSQNIIENSKRIGFDNIENQRYIQEQIQECFYQQGNQHRTERSTSKNKKSIHKKLENDILEIQNSIDNIIRQLSLFATKDNLDKFEKKVKTRLVLTVDKVTHLMKKQKHKQKSILKNKERSEGILKNKEQSDVDTSSFFNQKSAQKSIGKTRSDYNSVYSQKPKSVMSENKSHKSTLKPTKHKSNSQIKNKSLENLDYSKKNLISERPRKIKRVTSNSKRSLSKKGKIERMQTSPNVIMSQKEKEDQIRQTFKSRINKQKEKIKKK